jgi:cytochrome P450
MWPPVTGLGSKQVPKGGDVICGYHVPEGTQVAHNHSGVPRLKSIWGEDADVFRPERWLEAEAEGKERVKFLNTVIDLIFGGGKYQCLGKRIALMELNKILVEVGLSPLSFQFSHIWLQKRVLSMLLTESCLDVQEV